jgi:chromate reductase
MITILSGSPRKNSNTLRVAKAIQKHIQSLNNEETAHVIDFNEFDIPSMNAGRVDPNNLTEFQANLFNSCKESDLIFVLTPEYNWFPSAEIIQMVHTMAAPAFKDMWNNKVFVTCGTSNGRGGRMPAVQLSYTINKILNVFNCESMVSPKIFESQFTDKALDENGLSLGNAEYMAGLEAFVAFNLKLKNRWLIAEK